MSETSVTARNRRLCQREIFYSQTRISLYCFFFKDVTPSIIIRVCIRTVGCDDVTVTPAGAERCVREGDGTQGLPTVRTQDLENMRAT